MPGFAIYGLTATAQTHAWFWHDDALYEMSYFALNLELT